jgi:hypothetical protein
MNLPNLKLQNTQGAGQAKAISEANVVGSNQGMSEEFLALLSGEINPENAQEDILSILKDMPVEQVNELVKTFSEEVNQKQTTQNELVQNLVSQFETKEDLAKAIEINPKLGEIVKEASASLKKQNPILAQFVKSEQNVDSKEAVIETTDDFIALKSEKNNIQKTVSKNALNAFSQNSNDHSMIKVPQPTQVNVVHAAATQVVMDEKSETETTELESMKAPIITEKHSDNTNTVLSMKIDASGLTETPTNNTKVIDMNSLQNVENTDEMINKIQDYIVQSKVTGQKSIEMSFMHKDLGQFNLQVDKLDNQQIQVSIMSSSSDGAKFFKENQTALMNSLSQSGLQVSEIKLESSSDSKSSFEFEQKEGQTSDYSKESNDKQNKKEKSRRDELWQIFNGHQVA